jgi:hypothetical protein
MTIEELETAVSAFFESEGVNCLSPEGDERWENNSTCDCCESTSFGDRMKATGYHPESGEIREYECCWECLYFCAYGEALDT